MKRIVVLIDGTWNKEAITGNTNVATLDPCNWMVANAFIEAQTRVVSCSACTITTASAAKATSLSDCSAAPSASGLSRLFASATSLSSHDTRCLTVCALLIGASALVTILLSPDLSFVGNCDVLNKPDD